MALLRRLSSFASEAVQKRMRTQELPCLAIVPYKSDAEEPLSSDCELPEPWEMCDAQPRKRVNILLKDYVPDPR